MERDERHGRRSICLKGYDYTRDGAYFVTICTQERLRIFGTIVVGDMQLNECGQEVAHCWAWLAEQYPYVCLDEWIVMPDHTHAIIVITEDRRYVTGSDGTRSDGARSDGLCRGGSRTALNRTASTMGFAAQPAVGTDGSGFLPTKRKPLGRLIGAFKTVSTRRVNDLRSIPGASLWQRNYYEHVIRNEESLQAARRYIVNNSSL
jgi:putative transposase